MTDKKVTSLHEIRNRSANKKVKTLDINVQAECWLALVSEFDEGSENQRTAIHKLKELYPSLKKGLQQQCLTIMLGHTDEKYIAAWCATELFSYSEKTDLIEAKLMVYASLIVAAKNELLDISMLGTMGDKLGDIFLSDERDAITELLEEYFLADEAFEFIIEELIASAKIIDDDEYIATALTTALENEEISDSNKELVKNALFSFLNGKGFEATEVPGFNEITGSEVTDQPTYIDSVGTLNWESLIMDNTVAFPGSKKETTEE